MNKLQRGALAALLIVIVVIAALAPAGIGFMFAQRSQRHDEAERLNTVADAALVRAEDVTRRLSGALGGNRQGGGDAMLAAVSERAAAHRAHARAGARRRRLRSRRPLAMLVAARRGVGGRARRPHAAAARLALARWRHARGTASRVCRAARTSLVMGRNGFYVAADPSLYVDRLDANDERRERRRRHQHGSEPRDRDARPPPTPTPSSPSIARAPPGARLRVRTSCAARCRCRSRSS